VRRLTTTERATGRLDAVGESVLRVYGGGNCLGRLANNCYPIVAPFDSGPASSSHVTEGFAPRLRT
jgi:hypothetical protein